MEEEREKLRHLMILDQIQEANDVKELPSLSLVSITKFLAINVNFEERNISSFAFLPLLDCIIKYDGFDNEKVKKAFVKLIKKYYPEVSEEDILEKYEEIKNTNKINYLLEEKKLIDTKKIEIVSQYDILSHEDNLRLISIASDERMLPDININKLYKLMGECVSNIKEYEFSNEDIKKLSKVIMYSGDDKIALGNDILNFCSSLSNNDGYEITRVIVNFLNSNEEVRNLIIEIKELEKKKKLLYRQEHEYIMDSIIKARNINQLPHNLVFSTLTNYLSYNSMINPKEYIKAAKMKKLAKLLLEGNIFKNEEIISEIKNIAKSINDSEETFQLLYDKLSKLPKTYTYVKEINTCNKKQQELIGKSVSNVNVYFIPTSKDNKNRFYNCYINKINNLDLKDILPLSEEDIVNDYIDTSSIDWYLIIRNNNFGKTLDGYCIDDDFMEKNINIDSVNNINDSVKVLKDIIEVRRKEIEEFMKKQEDSLKELDELEKRINLLMSKER